MTATIAKTIVVAITIDMTIAEIVALYIGSGIAVIGMIVGRSMTDGMIVVATMATMGIGTATDVGIVADQPIVRTGTIREPDLSPKAERPQTIAVCGRSVLLRGQWRG